ncbi:hypothetical protein GTA08_BOTSDO07746 [Botryosphaeria dothidea]|uniref:Xylanolytic transcriptional activator regulatory domain-containing protein n=1 Tax=Botryosphaeria dothidea TaxID=55169 RepID=A0A8H4INL8_9PEZI|nr:hypothetical protein GTA08_BOTSDO07746 [Botryosphaeria dothidea]
MGYSTLDGATALGDLKKLLEGDNFFRAATSNNNKTQYADEAEAKYMAFIKKIPARKILQELIDVYFVESNWAYPISERPFFNELFTKWVSLDPTTTRYTGLKGLTRDLQYFPALLFSMCAVALQLSPPTTRCLRELDVVNATARDRLSMKMTDIAMEIMNLLGRHDPTLSGVQTDFLRAVWLKNASRGTEAWHALSDAIRQAQEIGLHRQAEIQQSSCLEETLRQLWYDEHKRRIWVILFTWNSFMAFVLGRPRQINISDCDIRTPMDCNIPEDPSKKVPLATPVPGDDEMPSFFSSSLVQYELSRKVHEMREMFADKPYTKDYNVVWNFHKQVLSILENAQPLVRPMNPDTSFDSKYPILPKKREQIFSVANNMIMVLHRPHMSMHVESRKAAVQAALNNLDSQERFFRVSEPHHYKLFGLTFYTNDAAIFLSAVILMYPPKDEEVKKRINDALKKAISRLEIMSKSNPTASSGARVVRTCYDKVKDILKPEGAESTGTMSSTETAWSGTTIAENQPGALSYPTHIGNIPEFSTGLDETLALPDDDLTSLAFWDGNNTFDSSYWINEMNQIPDLAPEDDPNNESTWDSLLL